MSMKQVRYLLCALIVLCNSSEAAQVTNKKCPFRYVDVVCILRDTWPETNKAEAKAVATEYMDRYLRNYVVPRLIEQGCEAKYVGISTSRIQVRGHGVLYVDYSEWPGAVYTGGVHGTSIIVMLELFSASSKKPVWKKIVTAETSWNLMYGHTTQTDALDNLGVEFSRLVFDFRVPRGERECKGKDCP